MASRINAFSSLIHGLPNPEFYTGFHFLPTYEDGIRIVNSKNAGGEVPPIFNEYDRLFQCQPEQLEECYCFTKLEVLGKNKVNRTLWDGSGRWKNIKSEFVRADNNIGWVTKLKLHMDKNTTTEWHILEYRETEMPAAGRWVLCHIYKRENNDNTTVPRVASDVEAGQISSSTSQVSSMRVIGASGDMNQGQHYEMGQCSYTQPDWFSNAATNPELTGGHMYQDQIHSVGQSWYTPQDSMVHNSQQILSSPNSIDDFDMGLLDDESIKKFYWPEF